MDPGFTAEQAKSPSGPRHEPWSGLQWLYRTVAFSLVYFAVGFGFAMLLRHQDISAPIGLSSGIALGIVICWGRRASLGVFIGYFSVVWMVSSQNGSQTLAGTTTLALGGTAQALFADWTVRHFLRQELLLARAREALLFLLLAGPASTLIYPSVVAASFVFFYHFPFTDQMPAIWLEIWIVQSSGIIVATPVVMSLLAHPREVWAPRLLSVALPMLLGTLLLILASSSIAIWDKQRTSANIEREADVAAQAIEGALREPLALLAATHGLLTVQADIGRTAFAAATRQFFAAESRVDFVGHAVLVERSPAALARFNASARADGLADFSARDSQQKVDSPPPADEAMMVIRNVEPAGRVAGEAGLNIRSARAGRTALAKTEKTGRPAATEGFLQDADQGDVSRIHVAVLQALFTHRDQTGDGHGGPMNGVVFVVLKPEILLRAGISGLSGRLKACLTDVDRTAAYRHLAGEPGCDSPSQTQPQLIRELHFAGSTWSLRLYPAVPNPVHASGVSLAFTLLGTLSMALLATLLLSTSAQARRVETLARRRKAELQRTSIALRAKEKLFRSVFDKAPVGVYIADLDGLPLEANPQFCRMLACSPQELPEVFRPFALEDALLAKRLADGHGPAQRMRVYTGRDGQVVQALQLASLLRDGQGQPELLVCVVQDMADQLKLDEHERARVEAEMANRAKSEFLSRMSHELRTPLNGLLGFAQLLQLGTGSKLDAQQRSWIEKISRAGWHLLAMINDVLDLSRIETGSLRVSLERQNLHKLIEEVSALMASAAQKRGISTRLHLPDRPTHVMGDATRIREILINLLSNAIKYNVDRGRVVVELREADGDLVELNVTDTGPGMSPAQLADLFQPFNRLGQERTSIEGTGIGLVISRRLAELMNGTLRLSSQRGVGSTATLTLPAAHGDVLAVAADLTPGLAPATWTGPRRVVYVEDNLFNIEVMQAVMAQRSLIQLSVFEEGGSALRSVVVDPPDLLLLDMQLPDTDGLQLLRRIRQAPSCADLPILVISANASDQQIRECLEAGARHYLTKPFDLRELLGLVDRLLAADR